MSDISEIQGVLSEMVSRTAIENIDCIRGEEKPEIIGNFLKEYLNIDQDITVTEYANFSTKYKIKIYGIDILYTICDSAGSSPDWIIYMKEGKHIFCEDTKAGLCGSGNNAQFQRFTKFVLEIINNNNYNLVYYLDNSEDESSLNKRFKGQTMVAFKCWKLFGIDLKSNNPVLQRILDNVTPYKEIHEFIEDWNKNSKKCKIILEKNYVYLKGFNILKNGTISNDPEIGKILLVIMTICNLSLYDIIIDKERITSDIISKSDNKFIKIINSINNNVREIAFNDICYNVCEYKYNDYFHKDSTSEKIVSIWEEVHRKNHNIGIVCFTNHARGSLEHLTINGVDQGSTPNKVYTPDLIWVDDDTETNYFVEAEKYENFGKKGSGLDQINSWKSGPKSENTQKHFKEKFKGTPYEDYSHRAYITLYIQDIDDAVDIKDMKHVKYILDSKGKLRTNDNVEYLDLNSS